MFIVAPYITYKLSVTKSELESAIEEYYSLFKTVSKKHLTFVTQDLSLFLNLSNKLKIIEQYMGDNVFRFQLQLKLKEKINIDDGNFQTKFLNYFVIGDENRLYSIINKLERARGRGEIISFLTGGIIGGNSEESVLKACWRVKKLIINRNIYDVEQKKGYEADITQGMDIILNTLKLNNFLIAFYLFHLKNKQFNDYFNEYQKYLNLQIQDWERRKKIVPLGSQTLIDRFNLELEESSRLINKKKSSKNISFIEE